MPNFLQIDRIVAEILLLTFFQDGGRPPSWICKSWKFELPIPFGGPKCVIVPIFVQIGQTVADIKPFLTFQGGGRSPSWIFTNWKI